MTRQPIKSSAIVSIGYDPDHAVLEVEFRGGRTYRYAEVPPEAHAAFIAAPSAGKHFAAHVANRYAMVRMEPPAPRPRG